MHGNIYAVLVVAFIFLCTEAASFDEDQISPARFIDRIPDILTICDGSITLSKRTGLRATTLTYL